MATTNVYNSGFDAADPAAALRKRVLDQQGEYSTQWDPNSEGANGGWAGSNGVPMPQAPAPFQPATADPKLLGPNFSGPTPASFGGPATTPDQVPVPGVNPQVVYTDTSGQGYDPAQLNSAWADPNFRNNPINARVGDILQQYGYGGGATNASPTAPSAQPAAPSAAAPASPASLVSTQTSNPWTDQIRSIILQRLQQAQSPVDENSPEIARTMEAAQNQATRQTDQERTALAERLYASGGLNTNALGQQIQQSHERNAGALGSLRANLLMNQYNQKRSELQNLLQLATASGDSESARSIQAQLANLQAAVQREGLGVNLAEFTAQLNQNGALAGL